MLTGTQLPQFAASLSTTATSVSTANNSSTLANASTATQLSSAPGLALGQTFNRHQSTGFSLPAASTSQFGLFQSPSVSTSASTAPVPGAVSTAPIHQPGGIFGAANSTAPATTSSGGFKFALSQTTQQQAPPPQQSSGLSLQTSKPSLSVAGSSAAIGSSLFGLKSGLQTATSNAQPSSSGVVFGVQPQQPPQQQASQLSLFGGANKVQSSQSSSSGAGISFNFAQQPSAIGGSGVGGMAASGSTSLNFASTSQQSQAVGGGMKPSNFSFSAGLGTSVQQKTTGLTFPASSQSGGLSLFNKSVNPQQQQQNSQPSSIFSGGGNTLQANQPNASGGLFSSQQQQQQSTSGFPGFKLSASNSGGSQTQPTQNLSIFGNTNSSMSNPLTGGSSSGISFTGGQGVMGGATGSSTSFSSFNAGPAVGGSSSGFNFSAGAANSGGVGGLFQKASATAAQSSNPLTAAAGNQQPKSGIGFNFSAGALGSQQQSQGSGGPFAFGQNTSSTSSINFATAASSGTTGIGIGNQTQNRSSGFNFSAGAGMGMNSGVKPTTGMFNNNSSSNVFQSPLQTQQSSSTNVFQTPQTQKQLSFTATPTNQPTTLGQGGITNSFSFSAGTPGGSASRPMARARRRKK